MNDYRLRLADLPAKIKAVVVLDEDGDYNIYINSKMSQEEQQRAFKHEMRHIKKAHFYSEKDVVACEKEAKGCAL